MTHVSLHCKLARDYTMTGVEAAVAYLLVKVVPSQTAAFGKLPLNICLVLDRSYSMEGEKLRCAKEAACQVVDLCSSDDWLSVVAFNEESSVVVANTKVDDRNALHSQINRLGAASGTCMHTGMEAGANEIRKGPKSAVNRMLLFTDGETTQEDKCRQIAHREAGNGLVVSTFGIGTSYNEDLLMEISNATLGSSNHLRTASQIKDVFGDEILSAGAVGITGANLTLKSARGVRVEEAHRIVPNIAKLDLLRIDDKTSRADIGAMEKNSVTCLGVKLMVPDRPPGRVRLAEVMLQYDIPSVQIHGATDKCDVVVEYTSSRELLGKFDVEVMGYFDQLTAQQLIIEGTRQAGAGDAAGATQTLERARAITQNANNALLTKRLDEALNDLQKKGVLSQDALKSIKSGSGKTVSLE